MGSYLFANQYQNEIIPEDKQQFKKNWFKYYTVLPKKYYTFAMIDPAIGNKKTSDYTGITVVSVDEDTNWYIRLAKRERMTPTEIINLCFKLHKEFNLMGLGIEVVAYQKALALNLVEEMQKRRQMIPLQEVHPGTTMKKEVRIRGVLVPRYEFGHVYHSQGLYDLETELLQFPRGSLIDIVDSLAMIEQCITYPDKEKVEDVKPRSAADPRFEAWFIRNLGKNKNQEERGED